MLITEVILLLSYGYSADGKYLSLAYRSSPCPQHSMYPLLVFSVQYFTLPPFLQKSIWRPRHSGVSTCLQVRGSPTDQQQGCWKKGKCCVTLGNGCSLGSLLPSMAKDAKKPKFTALVGLQVNSHPTARWGWRLRQWCCSLGFGPAHLMPNCYRASTLYFDPSCKTSGIGFDFQQHYCSCCWQHPAVVLLNINATRTQAWRKCKISTNRGICPPSNSFLCMCQN